MGPGSWNLNPKVPKGSHSRAMPQQKRGGAAMCLPGALSEVLLHFMRLHDLDRMHQLQAVSDALGTPADGVLEM